MQRRYKIHVLRLGGFGTVELVFDGKTLSVLNCDANVYGQSDRPGTVDQLVDTLRDDYQRPLPATDLLGADAGAVLLADVTAVTDHGAA